MQSAVHNGSCPVSGSVKGSIDLLKKVLTVCSYCIWCVMGRGGGVKSTMKMSRFLISKCWQVCNYIVLCFVSL